MVSWVLALIYMIAPPGSPTETFPDTAAGIDRAAHERPVYDGPDGVAKTAALLVAIARYESSFNPLATAKDSFGSSYGLLQIHESNVKRLHIAIDDLADPYINARSALVLVAESFRVCARKPEIERLAMYASGRGQCDVPEGVQASRLRVALAQRLLRQKPVTWVERQ